MVVSTMVVPHFVNLNKSWTGVLNSQLSEIYTTHPINEIEFTYKVSVRCGGHYVTLSTITRKEQYGRKRRKENTYFGRVTKANC